MHFHFHHRPICLVKVCAFCLPYCLRCPHHSICIVCWYLRFKYEVQSLFYFVQLFVFYIFFLIFHFVMFQISLIQRLFTEIKNWKFTVSFEVLVHLSYLKFSFAQLGCKSVLNFLLLSYLCVVKYAYLCFMLFHSIFYRIPKSSYRLIYDIYVYILKFCIFPYS